MPPDAWLVDYEWTTLRAMVGIDFKGKSIVQNLHLATPYFTLVPDAKKSLTKSVSLDDNLIIHGDNLVALKALLPNFAGRIKCIYIDPPYNTGNEGWAYNDNVNSPMMQDWLKKTVDREDLTRHDKWLCMMMPRLKLLRELLKDDGVIFVSIDDNEIQNLRSLLDEIFGEENFVAQMIWVRGRKNDSKLISSSHEYILCYARSVEYLNLHSIEWNERKEGIEQIYSQYDKLSRLHNGDWTKVTKDLQDWFRGLKPTEPAKDHEHYRYADQRGVYFASDISGPDDGRKSRPKYEVLHPITKKPVQVPARGWRLEHERMKKEIIGNRIHFGEDEKTVPKIKVYLKENEYQVPSSVFYKDGRAASGVLKDIMGAKIFDFPKDHEIIKRLILFTTGKNDIIFDSFAGSGTTAQAVLDLNKETGSNRKFILIQMPEETKKDSDAYNAGYKSIIDICCERVRRCISGVKTASDEKLKFGYGGSFSYFDLGKPIIAERMLVGKDLPNYRDLARYVYYTSIGKEFDEKKVDEKRNFIGQSDNYEVYLFYTPDIEYLKTTALTMERAKALGPYKGKKRLVFAPMKYLDSDALTQLNIEFCQLPYEIYRKVG